MDTLDESTEILVLSRLVAFSQDPNYPIDLRKLLKYFKMAAVVSKMCFPHIILLIAIIWHCKAV